MLLVGLIHCLYCNELQRVRVRTSIENVPNADRKGRRDVNNGATTASGGSRIFKRGRWIERWGTNGRIATAHGHRPGWPMAVRGYHPVSKEGGCRPLRPPPKSATDHCSLTHNGGILCTALHMNIYNITFFYDTQYNNRNVHD